jgi:hypothetical protein
MRKIGGFIIAAALVAAGIGVWSSSKLLAKHAVGEFRAPVAKLGAPVPGISAYEIHRKANVRDLPVAHDPDLTFIFPSRW